MATYRKYNWPELIQAFEQSGLTQAQFCQTHNLNPKYFSRKRTEQLKAQHPAEPVFQKAAVDPSSTQLIASHEAFVIEVSGCNIHCPASFSIEKLTALIKGLS